MRLKITCTYRYLRRHLLSGRFLPKIAKKRKEIGEDLDGPHRTGVIVAGVANVAAVSVVVITSFVAGTGITISTLLMATVLVVELMPNGVDDRLIDVSGFLPVTGTTVTPSVVPENEDAVVCVIDADR